jgi:hypothetical protein
VSALSKRIGMAKRAQGMRSGKDLKSKCPLVNAKSMRRRLAAGVLAPATSRSSPTVPKRTTCGRRRGAQA